MFFEAIFSVILMHKTFKKRNRIHLMKNKKISELDNQTIERVVVMAQKEKKPFEVLKNEFGLTEHDITDLMKKLLSDSNFEIWKKKALASKPKPKPIKYSKLEDDDLDSKYYFKDKFE